MPKELKKWKGKWVTNAVYNKRLKQRENGHNRKKEVSSDVDFPIKGCRIVDLEHMANDMKCKSCNHLLVLTNITDEIKKGLASILKVKCDNCLLINDVTTGKSHQHAGKHIKFDVNSKSTLGCLHTGMGHTQMEKYLSTLEIPTMSVKKFKKHEREVRKVTETVAKESCVIAAKFERSLTIEKSEELSKLLTEDKQDNFFIPTKDSSALFKKKFPERKAKGQLKLTSLASETFALSTKNAHNADYDVYLFEKLVEHHLDSNSLINSKINFQVVLAKPKMKETTEPIIATLQPLKGIIPDTMIQGLAQFNINYDLIVKTFKNDGIDKVTELLKQYNNGKAQLIKNQPILSAILEHLKNI